MFPSLFFGFLAAPLDGFPENLRITMSRPEFPTYLLLFHKYFLVKILNFFALGSRILFGQNLQNLGTLRAPGAGRGPE